MAANIPAKLKAADLTRFCVRAAQLETAKPVVAYWCEYWIANQILTKGLHNGDDETLNYTTTLMDKLERIKAENPTNDAIMDDMAGQAYVEQFASETFDRADRAVHANKVTKQTADTFQAAATFFELVNIWGPPDGETQSKIKYAKWNAVRIVKAIKEGKDPNESNPKPQPKEEPMPIDDEDGEQASTSAGLHHATVEDAPESEDQFSRDVAAHGPADDSLRPVPSPTPSKPEVSPSSRDEFTHTEGHDDNNVSPLESSQSNDRSGSIGGGFFPVPTFTAAPNDTTLPTAPPSDVNDLGLPNQPSFTPGSDMPPTFGPPPTHPSGPQDYYRPTPSPVQPSSMNLPYIPPHQPSPQPYQPPQNMHGNAPQQYPQPPAQYQAPVQPPPSSGTAAAGRVEVDDEAITQAQKHARWAISALNFEDTNTAIRELREALKTLGATT